MGSDQLREIASLSGEHLTLVGASILLACLIAIPSAILLSRRPGPRRAALSVRGTKSQAIDTATRKANRPSIGSGLP